MGREVVFHVEVMICINIFMTSKNVFVTRSRNFWDGMNDLCKENDCHICFSQVSPGIIDLLGTLEAQKLYSLISLGLWYVASKHHSQSWGIKHPQKFSLFLQMNLSPLQPEMLHEFVYPYLSSCVLCCHDNSHGSLLYCEAVRFSLSNRWANRYGYPVLLIYCLLSTLRWLAYSFQVPGLCMEWTKINKGFFEESIVLKLCGAQGAVGWAQKKVV